MKLTGDTIFITGATSGIGLTLAIALSKRGNKIIVSGRDETALKEVVAHHPDFITRVCDVSSEQSMRDTAAWLAKEHHVNILINNAGVFNNIDLTHQNDLSVLGEEATINYLGPVKLISLILPALQKEKNPAVIIISSGVAYMPLSNFPLYSASKAALHSFSISLRNQLRKTPVKVIEILPPTVETRLTAALKGYKMPVDVFVQKTIKAITSGKEEIPIGQSKLLNYFARLSPSFMNYILNRSGYLL